MATALGQRTTDTSTPMPANMYANAIACDAFPASQCPKCQAQMVAHDVDGVEADRGGVCGGMWFDLGEQAQLLSSDLKEAKALDLCETARSEANKHVRDIDGPCCHTKMAKLAHYEQRHIEYEQCSQCGGAYLDSGEFDDLRDLTLAERLRKLFPKLLGTRKPMGDNS